MALSTYLSHLSSTFPYSLPHSLLSIQILHFLPLCPHIPGKIHLFSDLIYPHILYSQAHLDLLDTPFHVNLNQT